MALRELFASFGIDIDTKKLDKANKKVDSLWDKLKKFAPAIAGGAIAKGVMSFAEHISTIGDELDKASIRTGVGTDELQALGFAAGQSGATVEGLTTGLLMLSDRMADAGQGGKETAEAFGRLGIHVKDAAGHTRATEEVMLDAADAIAAMSSPAEQAAAAVKLFGRQGRELLPFLKEGRKGIAAMTKEAKELGGGFSKNAVKAARDYNDALGRLTFVTKGAQGAIATKLLPVLQKVVDWTTKAAAAFLGWVKNSYAIQTAIGALAAVFTVLAIKTAIIAAPVLAAVAAFAALFLIVEDLVTLFNGGESVIGEWIDEAFGKGQSTALVESLKEAWESVSEQIKKAYEWAKRHTDEIRTVLGIVGTVVKLPFKAAAAIGEQIGSDIGTSDANAPAQYTGKGRGSVSATPVPQWSAPMSSVVTAPMSGGSSMSYSSAPQISMTVNGGDPAQVKQAVRDALDEHSAATYDALSSHAEAR